MKPLAVPWGGARKSRNHEKARFDSRPQTSGRADKYRGCTLSLSRIVGGRSANVQSQTRRRTGIVLSLALWFSVPVFGAETDDRPFPLERPSCASPRDTLQSFLRDTGKGLLSFRQDADPKVAETWFDRAEFCLDLSEVSADLKPTIATEAALLLNEVINRVGLPAYSEIPGVAEVEASQIESWTLPRTEISITRVAEGERAGQFLFSPQTVASSLEFYNQVKDLPNLPGYVPGNYEGFVISPDYTFVPHLWANDLPNWLKATFLRNPVWKWLSVIVVFAVAVLLILAIHGWRRRWDAKYSDKVAHRRVGGPIFALSLIFIPLLADLALQKVIGVRFGAAIVFSKLLLGLTFAGAVVAVFSILSYVADTIVSARRFQQRGINAHFVRLLAQIFAIALSLVLVVQATEFLGFPLAPLLAGLGIGGLAVALAARTTLENAIAGFIMFADKPVRVGEYCRFGEQEGTVEEIGLRSTRIRRLDDVLVVVPNGDLSQMQLENYTKIEQRLFRTTLALRYETTAEQMRFVLVKLREMLIGHPMVSPKKLHVRFLGFGDFSLDVEIFAHTRTPAWLEFRAISEDLNLRIMDIVESAGTGFAFPSQTAYFTRDQGLDADNTEAAEEEVADWRARGQLPFPEFAQDLRLYMQDTLDFPPRGSPDYRAREDAPDVNPPPTPRPNPAKKS